MAYFDERHVERIEQLNSMWQKLDGIEELARGYEIRDIAQDNNLKLLQTLVLFGFDNQPGREGSDAIDRYGNEWELKTVNIDLTKSFSTNHHTNLERIAVFRRERWLFSVYRGISLQEVYAVSPSSLEIYFAEWEKKVRKKIADKMENPHLNNPKIPLKFVRQVGIRVYPFDDPPVDPAEELEYLGNL
ncbi:MAG: restriction endonuclease [Clostridiales bacterium]|nr:restriction endonuclease [Clostridiales bacterium]